jgi:excinuclease ABC subunit C
VKAITLTKDPAQLESRLQKIPTEPGVYLMHSGDGEIIYIGKSKRLRSRVRSYFRESTQHSSRIAKMVRMVAEIEFIVTDTEAEALALEANLIKRHQPRFNVLLKDDKKYPYVLITLSEKYPRIFITRNRRLGKSKDRYYGPYTDGRSLGEVLGLIKRVFPLRQRPQPLHVDRPCLNYDIGRCPGVCQELISPEDYRQIVDRVAAIFQGRTAELIENMTEEMEKFATDLNFEKAAIWRDRLRALQSLNQDRKVSLPDDRVSRDAIALAADDRTACVQLFQVRAGKLVGRLGFIAEVTGAKDEVGSILQRVLEEHYQTVEPIEIPGEIVVQAELPEADILAEYLQNKRGKKVTIVVPQRQVKAELIDLVERNANYELTRQVEQSDRANASLEDLIQILDLPTLPRRIECYDISHIQGSNAVASQVVFINGLPAKQHYRHYKIKNPEIAIGHSDDFASHAEIARRRFRKFAGGVDTDANDFPDVVIIDGGKGQLSAVTKVLAEYQLLDSLCVVSLAKQREEIFIPNESLPLPTHPEQPGVQLLRRLRDESHRFAISFHRQQRGKAMTVSTLDSIPGLGKHRQKLLLDRFHSVDRIRMAEVAELTQVSGISERLAKDIYSHFHS